MPSAQRIHRLLPGPGRPGVSRGRGMPKGAQIYAAQPEKCRGRIPPDIQTGQVVHSLRSPNTQITSVYGEPIPPGTRSAKSTTPRSCRDPRTGRRNEHVPGLAPLSTRAHHLRDGNAVLRVTASSRSGPVVAPPISCRTCSRGPSRLWSRRRALGGRTPINCSSTLDRLGDSHPPIRRRPLPAPGARSGTPTSKVCQ